MTALRTDVVTIGEGAWGAGLGALVNSLVAAGFTGRIWAGWRGPRPGWAAGVRLPRDVSLEWVGVDPDRHLTNAKAPLLLDLLGRGVEAAAYFDTDVTVTHPWRDFPPWIADGIAVCADVNPWFPATHPVRRAWRRVADELGDPVGPAPVDLYVNAGFVGVSAERAPFLERWERYTVAFAERGPGLRHGPGGPEPGYAGRTSPFMTPDQDALNLAVMAHHDEVAMMGPQAMGLATGWPLMSHAIGAPKPWAHSFAVSALRGRAPTRADAHFLRFAREPVAVLGPRAAAVRRADLALARIVARATTSR